MAKQTLQQKRASVHYVNNAMFSKAVVEYCTTVTAAKEAGEEIPIVPNYIAECFLKIAEGLSMKLNFIRYTYREELVMDAVENCLRAINNYNIEVATRTGLPNAFAYFTQISWYAFLRRIAKEKKQQDVKLRYVAQSGVLDYIINETGDIAAQQVAQSFLDQLKDRIDKVKEKDTIAQMYVREDKIRKKREALVDSDLLNFLED
jgi:hypothetical protein